MRSACVLALCWLVVACEEGRVVPPAAGAVDAGPQGAPDVSRFEDGATAGGADAGLEDAAARPDAADPGAAMLARGITLSDVALFQAVKVGLVVDGAEPRPRNAPVIAERDALVRLYVRPGPGWVAEELTGVLLVGGARYEQTQRISGPSSDGVVGSAFDLSVPASALREGARWSAWLESRRGAQVPAGASDPARWPRAGGDTELRAQRDGGGLVLVLVPMRYDTDGSGRLPDTSAAQLDRYRELLRTLYPVAHVELRLHDPVSWTRSPTFTGNVDFGALNDALVDLRAAEAPDDDVYYYALIDAADTFDDYCGRSCVTGQSFVPEDPLDAELRVGAGVGFTGEDSAWTLVHELGHLHGRYHAPCDVDDADGDYPYADGDIGSWGYDPRDSTLVEPNAGWSDFMGYCDAQWVSDYTFAALFARIIEQRGGTVLERRRPWIGQALTVGGGAARLDAPRGWSRRPVGPARAARFLDVFGRVLGFGEATRLARSHEEDRRYLIDLPPPGAHAVQVEGEGTFAL